MHDDGGREWRDENRGTQRVGEPDDGIEVLQTLTWVPEGCARWRFNRTSP